MKFDTVEQLSTQFCSREIATLEPTIVIGEEEFRYKEEKGIALFNAEDGSRQLAVYQSLTGDMLVFGWALQEGLSIVPVAVKKVSIQNESIVSDRDKVLKVKQKYEERIIGQHIQIVLSGLFQNEPIIAKVDTGASCCSLDAQDVKVGPNQHGDGEVVTFMFRNRRYRMLIQQYQSVTSADGGTKNRPVVKFTVRYREQVLQDVLFNLNDRDGMEYDVLIGNNMLTLGKFLIDPLKESVSDEEWTTFQTLMKDEKPQPISVAKVFAEAIKKNPALTFNEVFLKL